MMREEDGSSYPETATEMPARVEPVDGAQVVDFPWELARATVAALNDARATLGTQLDTRVEMYGTLSDWAGAFRDEFNSADSRLTIGAINLRDDFGRKAAAIVTAAGEANHQQTENNTRAEAELVPAGGHRPI